MKIFSKKTWLLISLLWVTISSTAYDFEVDGLYYSVISQEDKTCEVTYGDEVYMGDVNIPSTVKYDNIEFSVIGIGSEAFADCNILESITIPNSVTSIGDMAFNACGSLTSITIPNSVTSIGKGPLALCRHLINIIVEEGNEHYVSVDGILYNKEKTELIQFPCGRPETEYNIPASVTSIGAYAFEYCDNLTSVTIPNSVESIGESAFDSCRNLTSVDIPNSVTSIGKSAFSYCRSLESAIISENVSIFEEFLFEKCSKLKKIIDLNPAPQEIKVGVFVEVPKDAVIYVPQGSKEAYRSAEGWSYFSDFREITDDEDNAVESISGDSSALVDVYNLNGVQVACGVSSAELSSLPAGLYIVRQGSKTRKIMVK